MSTVMLAFAPTGAEPPANKSQSTQTSGCVSRFSPDLGWLQARDRERLSLPASHLATRIQFQFLICGWAGTVTQGSSQQIPVIKLWSEPTRKAPS